MPKPTKIAPEILARMNKETQYRELNAEKRSLDIDARTVELAFSSEMPVERWFGIEILDPTESSIRLNRLQDSAALLMDHNPRDQIGVIESVRIDNDRKGRAVVRFSRSERGQEIFQDVQDDIRTKVSVGYIVHDAVLERTGDDGDQYRLTDWEPFEISFVSVPADTGVGVGRNQELGPAPDTGALPPLSKKSKEERNMTDKTKAPVIDVDAERKSSATSALKLERERVKEIHAIAERSEAMLGKETVAKLARAATGSDQSLADFQATILASLNERSKQQRSPIGLSDNEAQSFRFSRAIAAAANGNWKGAEFERDVCAATSQRISGNHGGIMVPTDVLSRAVNTTTVNSTIQTNILASSFIDSLRASMKVRELGATVLGGLEGNVSIPKKSAVSQGFWVAEGIQPTQSDVQTGSLNFTPKGVAAEVPMTLQAVMQSSLDMESLIRQDIVTAIALAADLAALHGSGTGAEPLGIFNTAGVISVPMGVNGAALTNLDPLVDLETNVTDANVNDAFLAYLTNSRVVGALKKLKTTTGEYLFKGAIGEGPQWTGSANGYNVARSNQISKLLTKGTGTGLSGMVLGDWSNLVIGEWGALNLQVDTYTGGLGNIKIQALQFMDIGIRQPQAFGVIPDIITA